MVTRVNSKAERNDIATEKIHNASVNDFKNVLENTVL